MRRNEGNQRYCIEVIANGRDWQEINCDEGSMLGNETRGNTIKRKKKKQYIYGNHQTYK